VSAMSIIYEVAGISKLGSKIIPVEKIFGAKDSSDAVRKLSGVFSKNKGKVTITSLGVWGGSGRKNVKGYDPNLPCDCHKAPLWKCVSLLPTTASVSENGVSF